MKRILFISLLVLISFSGYSQNYYQENPITATVINNGSQYRLECSTYDSLLQTLVYFNTQWTNYNIEITGNNYGKVGYKTPNPQSALHTTAGIIIYDHELHQFVTVISKFSTAFQSINIICGPVWVEVVNETYGNGTYLYYNIIYRYNLFYHKWIQFSDQFSMSPVSLFNNSIGNIDRLQYFDDVKFMFYDPVADIKYNEFSNCLYFGDDDIKEDHFLANDTCGNFYQFWSFDSESNARILNPVTNLMGQVRRGIFSAFDVDSTFKKYFFIYDNIIDQWVTDSTYSPFITNIQIRGKIVTYLSEVPGLPKQVVYQVYNPISHSWVKDSAEISGTASYVTIELNGSVTWTDNNGFNIRGYDENAGWVNTVTPPLLHFQLTDFSSQGVPMIHVKNFSVGSDSVYFYFGDGVISGKERNGLWHQYKSSGTYNVCLYNSTGTQTVCQQVTMNICAITSAITFSNDTICQGDSLILSITGVNGIVRWQSKIGNNWVDELGIGSDSTTYVLYPIQSALYRAKISSGNCTFAYTNEQAIMVYEYSTSYVISDSLVTKCSNGNAILNVANSHGSFQWQSDCGSGWNNIANGQNNYYNVNTSLDCNYRVIISNGNCFADTSGMISVSNEITPSAPITTDGTTCGLGFANMQATSTGIN